MSYQFNEQFAAASRQFADAAARINTIALDNMQTLMGLQLATFSQNADATFAFASEAAATRDLDGIKALWPKGAQIARENVERCVSAGQEAIDRTVKTHEAITGIARSQTESATADVRAEAAKAAGASDKSARR